MVTAHNVTTKRDIVDPLAYDGEGDTVTTPANYGVTPTSATFNIVGNCTEINPQPDIQHIDTMQLGSEDIQDAVKSGSLYAFNFKFNPIDTTLAKFVVQAAGTGVGTIDESLSFSWSEKLNGITHSDGGASPFTWDGDIYAERRFSFTVTRDLAIMAVNGENDIVYAKNAGRNITFSTDVFTGTLTSNPRELQADWEAKTARTADYEIGSDTITFTKSVLTSWGRTHAAGTTDAVIESITARAESVAIA